jgi:uncharacterized protein
MWVRFPLSPLNCKRMTENLYTPKSIRTYSGKYVNVFDPNPEDILIEDIAHSLSNQCRFTGHVPHFYSVAQHSLIVAKMATDEYKLAALLHDASEAYLVDLPSPIKREIPEFKQIEERLLKVIAEKFGFEYPLPDEVHRLDKLVLEREWEWVINPQPVERYVGKSGFEIYPMYDAKEMFLRVFFDLKR